MKIETLQDLTVALDSIKKQRGKDHHEVIQAIVEVVTIILKEVDVDSGVYIERDLYDKFFVKAKEWLKRNISKLESHYEDDMDKMPQLVKDRIDMMMFLRDTIDEYVYAVEEEEDYEPMCMSESCGTCLKMDECNQYGGYSSGNPWDAPGLSLSDFF
ncbi:MAG: hypothetical protein NWF07_13780 [Candidatus Bathyarchaeota archaeon]|nr:hypothetical protein [Candidatus Bathyarchaeota archaeon]